MGYLLAFDQGTTSSRAILFDNQARPVSSHQQEIQQIFSQPGWVEHDPIEIWNSQLECARRAIYGAKINPSEILGIGISNQRETTVLWNRKTGKPLHNAIVWQDRRTAQACEDLRANGHGERIAQLTGLELDAYFSATKLAWLLKHVPEAKQQALRGELAFGTIDSWLVWNLTGGGVHCTDASNASRTQLFNIHTLGWDDILLSLFDIPDSVLPKVVSSSGVVAECKTDLLGAAIPIAALVGDQQAAMFGQACFGIGTAKNTYGTGCFMLQNTGNQIVQSQNRMLSTVGWQLGGETTYMLEGSVFAGGAVVQWLRDGLGVIQNAAQVEELAASVSSTQGVTLVPAFAGLGAPHWDAHARAALLGMSRGTTRAHIARAALESIALQTVDLLQAMQRDSGKALLELRVDGGASTNNLLMQMQADLLNLPVVRPTVIETSALGAALLAGLAVGVFQNTNQLLENWQVASRFEPTMSEEVRLELFERWNKAVKLVRGGSNAQ